MWIDVVGSVGELKTMEDYVINDDLDNDVKLTLNYKVQVQ